MKKRPTWSLKPTFLFLLGLLLVVIPLVLFVFEKSIWVQLELVTTVIAGFMFLFLVYVMVWKGRGCSGRLGKAIRYAGLFTLAGSIWFYAILLVSHYIVTRPGPSG